MRVLLALTLSGYFKRFFNEFNGFPAKGMGAEIPGLLAVAVLLPFKPGLRIWRTRLGTRAIFQALRARCGRIYARYGAKDQI